MARTWRNTTNLGSQGSHCGSGVVTFGHDWSRRWAPMDDYRTSAGRAAATRQGAVLTVRLLHASGMELHFASLPRTVETSRAIFSRRFGRPCEQVGKSTERCSALCSVEVALYLVHHSPPCRMRRWVQLQVQTKERGKINDEPVGCAVRRQQVDGGVAP